jgi:hypothetical protein
VNASRNNPVKLRKLHSGAYVYFILGNEFTITRNNERDSSWYGEWAIIGNNSYSDPIATLQRCRAALNDMQKHPEQYDIKQRTFMQTYVCANCVELFERDRRTVMDNGAMPWCDKCSQHEMEKK